MSVLANVNFAAVDMLAVTIKNVSLSCTWKTLKDDLAASANGALTNEALVRASNSHHCSMRDNDSATLQHIRNSCIATQYNGEYEAIVISCSATAY